MSRPTTTPTLTAEVPTSSADTSRSVPTSSGLCLASRGLHRHISHWASMLRGRGSVRSSRRGTTYGSSRAVYSSKRAAIMAEHTQNQRNEKVTSPSIPPRGHIGLVVLGSMTSGLVVALVLALLAFGGFQEPTITGLVLVAFAAGWAMLAAISVRRTDQPQRWAVIPAAFMGLSGLGFLVFQPGNSTVGAIGWVWPVVLVVLVGWMVVQARRSLHNWSRRVVLYPVFAVLVAMAVGAGYQTVGQAQDQAALRMRGRLVDIGNHRLHIECTGTGSPTVVLEGGLGEPSTTMAGWIAPALAPTTRVCWYDRSGYGWSDPAPRPEVGRTVAANLHTLLAAAGITPPYVLAGHSSGGVYTRIFAGMYPTEVAGMVMLDAQPPTVYTQLPGWRTFYSLYRRGEALAPSLARVGIARIGYDIAPSGLPPAARAEQEANLSTAGYYRALHDELAQLRTSLTQAQHVNSLGDKPLIVVTAGKDAQDGWLPLQDKMLQLSTNSVHRVLPDVSHASLIEDHHDSTHASSAILDVVHAVRTGAPLNTH
jgi:pimeloyl-ACP methyl ester carboxylesterase